MISWTPSSAGTSSRVDRYLDDMKSHLQAKHDRNAQRRNLLASDVPEKIDAELAAIRSAVGRLYDLRKTDEIWVVPPVHRLVEDILE